MLALCIAG
jgi:hypothetical protein